jgi:hypothetical protein
MAALGSIPARIHAPMALMLSAALLLLSSVTAHAADDLVRSGTLTIEQVQIAFIGSGNLGGGTLNYGGQQYDIEIGGLGVGGIGVSRMTATGIVYNLHDVRDFAGAYVQARYGMALGDLSG